MIWKITSIDEADFGCEERMPGEPLMVIVTLESQDGREAEIEVADSYLTFEELDEGDEWPDDLDEIGDESDDKYARQMQWMEHYLDEVESMEEVE